MLKIVIGTNEGKVLCISNNEDKIKASMVNYLIDTDQEPIEDFFESQNLGEYDIEVYEYHQPQLTDDQQVVLEWLTENIHLGTLPFNQISLLNQSFFNSPIDTSDKYLKAFGDLDSQEQFQVLAAFAEWGLSTLDN